jgi:hypothetical protein
VGDPYVFAAARTRELNPNAGYFVIRDTEKLIALSTPDFHPAQPPVSEINSECSYLDQKPYGTSEIKNNKRREVSLFLL